MEKKYIFITSIKLNNLHKSLRVYKEKGFTLLETLLVIAIIAILAGIVIIAINPGRQLAQARNAQRASDLNTIHKAVQQYYIDHRDWPTTTTYSNLTEICDENDLPDPCFDLDNLVPDYLPAIPQDPQADTGTDYFLALNTNNTLALTADNSIEYDLPLVAIGATTTAAVANSVIYRTNAFVSTWNTENLSTGSSDSNQIKIPTHSGGIYNSTVYWGDGESDTITTYNDSAWTHTYDDPGIYTIQIVGTFPRIYFANTGDKLKILSVDQWGDVGWNYAHSMFNGCANLTSIADDVDWLNSMTYAQFTFQNTGLTTLPDILTLDSLISGWSMFMGSSIESLPSGMTLDNLTDGRSMFRDTPNLTSIPSGMVLDGLTNFGSNMFSNSRLESLPSGMTLDNVTDGSYMFYKNNLTSLPSGMVLDNVTNGWRMFTDNELTSLPSGMTLAAVTDGREMFYNNLLTSLPSGLTLTSLDDGSSMFRNNSSLATLSSGMMLSNLRVGSWMFMDTAMTSLPSGMTLNNLVTATYMFYNTPIVSLPSSMRFNSLNSAWAIFMNTNLASLPDGMTLGNLTDGRSFFTNAPITALPSSITFASLSNASGMFSGSGITSIPTGVTFSNVGDALNMFNGATSFTSIPSSVTFASMTRASTMFYRSTINTTDYSNLLINIEANNSSSNITFHGGSSKYNSSAQSARNALVARGWSITDGGLE